MRLVLVVAVLVQYSPMRLCALERVTLGSNCHDRESSGIGGSHDDTDDEHTCGNGTGAGGEQRCICEQPKIVGGQQRAAYSAVDLNGHVVVVTVVEDATAGTTFAIPDPGPPRNLRASVQLPLLI